MEPANRESIDATLTLFSQFRNWADQRYRSGIKCEAIMSALMQVTIIEVVPLPKTPRQGFELSRAIPSIAWRRLKWYPSMKRPSEPERNDSEGAGHTAAIPHTATSGARSRSREEKQVPSCGYNTRDVIGFMDAQPKSQWLATRPLIKRSVGPVTILTSPCQKRRDKLVHWQSPLCAVAMKHPGTFIVLI